jgi:hypothetical protein
MFCIFIFIAAVILVCASRPVYEGLNIDSFGGTHSLNDWVLAKSPTKDYLGNHYYFLSSSKDGVSREMIAGTWEAPLNELFKDLWSKSNDHKNHIVMDVGVNFGCFFMFACSLGAQVYGFEMQPKLATAVEIGIRMSGYKSHAHLQNAALWYGVKEMSFSPDGYGNLGATSLRSGSNFDIKVHTARIDSLMPVSDVSFHLLDVH